MAQTSAIFKCDYTRWRNKNEYVPKLCWCTLFTRIRVLKTLATHVATFHCQGPESYYDEEGKGRFEILHTREGLSLSTKGTIANMYVQKMINSSMVRCLLLVSPPPFPSYSYLMCQLDFFLSCLSIEDMVFCWSWRET